MIRDEETLQASTYATRLPEDLSGRQCYVLDPMLATGGTLVAAIELPARPRRQRHHRDLPACRTRGRGGRWRRRSADVLGPVTVVTAGLDERLNELGYIVPGLGDAGDRLYGVV